MALDIAIFQTIVPSRFLCFTIPSPTVPAQLLRVAVLDSPAQPADPPRVAALFVPLNRESDWVFSTESGQLQLLLSSPGISRLILIGNNPTNGPHSQVTHHNKEKDTQFAKSLENVLKPLFMALSPHDSAKDDDFDVPILSYEDNITCSVVLERCIGVSVGEFLVEDVEIENDDNSHDNCMKREFRRRLRFRRMPNLVQTEIRIMPERGLGLDRAVIGGEMKFRPDVEVLVHPYLIPMVASLSLIGDSIEQLIRKGRRPRALCLGVGGGALLSFLKSQLSFEVVGVEMDEEVVRVARQHFGLESSDIRVCVGDAIELMEKLPSGRSSAPRDSASSEVEGDCISYLSNGFTTKFEVVMVDLDCCDAMSGVSAPPLDFARRHILLAARSLLSDFGILVINVIPPCRSFYDTLVDEFRGIFCELYEIDVGNEENFVLIGAAAAPIISSITNSRNSFLERLRVANLGNYLDSIRKI